MAVGGTPNNLNISSKIQDNFRYDKGSRKSILILEGENMFFTGKMKKMIAMAGVLAIRAMLVGGCGGRNLQGVPGGELSGKITQLPARRRCCRR